MKQRANTTVIMLLILSTYLNSLSKKDKIINVLTVSVIRDSTQSLDQQQISDKSIKLVKVASFNQRSLRGNTVQYHRKVDRKQKHS